MEDNDNSFVTANVGQSVETQNTISIFEKIYHKAQDAVDIAASYMHYQIFGEIKVIYKDKGQQCNEK